MQTGRFVLILCIMMLITLNGVSAPKARLIAFWQTNDPQSTRTVDHSLWQTFLQRYVVTGQADGINRIRYQAVSAADKQSLGRYLQMLSAVDVLALRRKEQRAFWINLYNALTVKLVLDHFPVTSIMKINISPGWFSRGPWGAQVITVAGKSLSLDNIEHGILRPIWHDPRIHYAVNCASLGCPNLQPLAFTADNGDKLLDQGAKSYINHARGVSLKNGRLAVSSIYHWFKTDFGGTDRGVIRHLRQYAEPALAKSLATVESIASHDYDWRLNKAE